MWLLSYTNVVLFLYYGIGTVQKTDNKSKAVLFLNSKTKVLIVNELDMLKVELFVKALSGGQN